MIISIKDEETYKVYHRQFSKKLPNEIQKTAFRKLMHIQSAVKLSDLASPPGNHLEPLHGDREGEHSIWINDQYRICFKWTEGGAVGVEIVDYHR